jgi:subtilisin family serine protease
LVWVGILRHPSLEAPYSFVFFCHHTKGSTVITHLNLRHAAAAAIALLGVQAAWAQTARMDATLALAAGQSPAAAARMLPKSIVGGSEAQTFVAATIRFTGDPLPTLRAMGVRIGSVSGNIATADIPLSKLQQVVQVSGVLFVEAAKPLPNRLSASVPATGATSLRTGQPLEWTGATGAGVIVGVVDDGLDFRHQDFRKADGTTRLLGLWDQRAAAQGTPPTGFDYGHECTPALLNQAIKEGTSSTACAQPSTGNHGTHVGGIAAGNGQATGNGQAAFRYIGMAPMADIIAANSIGGGVQSSNAVVDGINYVKAKAKALGKPAVVNLSLGSYFGNRDGTSNFETAITNAIGPGFIITAAAGNEGADPIRVEGDLAEGGSLTVGYRIPDKQGQRVEIWYPSTKEWSVQVSSGSCTTEIVPINTPSYSVETACGNVGISNNAPNPLNDDRQILIQFSESSSGKGPAGDWEIKVISVKGAGTVSMMGGEDSNGGVFTTHLKSVTTQILTDTCSATGAICVGAYVTRQEWTTVGGQTSTNTNHGPIGDVAIFSSRGPRRNCSNLAKCPPVAKPEILAPGAMIQSALGHDAKESSANPLSTTVDADGVHIAYNGTSMATPHVSGAVALLLQKNPNLTTAEVRKLLLGHLQTNNYTPKNLPVYDAAVANPANADVAWGYGIMDIAKAYAALTGTGGGTPSNPSNPSASEGSIAAQVSGDAASGVNVAALITPSSSEMGKPLQTFVVAVLPNGVMFANNHGSWQPLSMPVPAFSELASASGPITVQVLSNFKHAGFGLGGTMVFVGYGTDAAQMISQQKFKLIHTLGN